MAMFTQSAGLPPVGAAVGTIVFDTTTQTTYMMTDPQTWTPLASVPSNAGESSLVHLRAQIERYKLVPFEYATRGDAWLRTAWRHADPAVRVYFLGGLASPRYAKAVAAIARLTHGANPHALDVASIRAWFAQLSLGVQCAIDRALRRHVRCPSMLDLVQLVAETP